MLTEFISISPELLLLCIACFAQLFAIFTHKKRYGAIIAFVLVALTFVALAIFLVPRGDVVTFNESFVNNTTTLIAKILVLVFVFTSIILYHDFCKVAQDTIKIEQVTLFLFSSLGLFISISARNLLLLFCALELQALTGYALACMSPEVKAHEAAIKYFVLGSCMSCISLLGISFLYGFSGSLSFDVIFTSLSQDTPNIAIVIGAVLMFGGLLFKLSVAPLHIWTPDVYEGSSISTVSYFATAQKIGGLFVLLNILTLMLWDYKQVSVSLIQVVAILSMIVGAFGAMRQESLKRLMAYSTILNVGYALVGVYMHDIAGIISAIVYMCIYIVGVLGFFACLVSLLGKGAQTATFDDISGISLTKKAIAGAIAIIMFSMIGIPPLAGFFGKYYIFYQAIKHEEFAIAGIGIATSVIAAYYYLKIVKAMYFTKPKVATAKINISNGLLLITCVTTFSLIFFSYYATSYLELLTT